MEIVDLKDHYEYLKEYFMLCSKEWGTLCSLEELEIKSSSKVDDFINGKNINLISALGLISDNKLLGFISLLKTDGEDRTDLSPWYGTMYVKEEYRGNGYSKILNDVILKEAKRLGYSKVYLKTSLVNYYEKFKALKIGKLNNDEYLYYIEI